MSIKSIKEYIEGKSYMFASWFGITNPWGSDDFTTVGGTVSKVTTVINTAIYASALVLVGLLVYGGYIMITAAGDGDKIEQAQSIITNAIIGMVIVFIARMIIMFLIDRVL
jgi:ABC-type Na+ efflux pump permease subunit